MAAGKKPDLTGVHFVSRKLADGRRRWHVYAWRSGPKIMEAAGGAKPSLTADAVAAFVTAHESKHEPRRDTFSGLVAAYLKSPEYLRLAATTRKQWRMWIDRANDEFGDARLNLFSNPKMRGTVLEYRDKWAHSPRSADYALEVLSRVLSWGLQRGWVMHNPAHGAPTLYRNDRSEIIWEDHEIEAVAAQMAPHVARAFKLASWTGLARGDLIGLRWNEIGELYISRKRGKTKVEAVIPLFDETRALLAEFPKIAVTVVTNARKQPFTARGFASAVEEARAAAGVAIGKTLHDLRGTFATRLMRNGFEDREIDEILGWETGKSARIRRVYINRKAVVISAIERMRKRDQ
jgi:integrase